MPGPGATGQGILYLAQPPALIKHRRPQTSLGLGKQRLALRAGGFWMKQHCPRPGLSNQRQEMLGSLPSSWRKSARRAAAPLRGSWLNRKELIHHIRLEFHPPHLSGRVRIPDYGL